METIGQSEGRQIERKCVKCGEVKPLTEQFFSRRNSGRRPFRTECRDCKAAYHAAYLKRPEVKVRLRTRHAAYRENNQEHVRQAAAAYYQRNKESIKAKTAAHYTRPETKARIAALQADPDWQERRAAYQAAYRATPEIKARLIAYENRPDIKERKWDRHLRRKYGITAEERQALLVQQGGRCAICQKPLPDKAHATDHNHKTGEVRGLLCRKCNLGVAFIERLTPAGRARALRYLEKRVGTANPSASIQPNLWAEAQT